MDAAGQKLTRDYVAGVIDSDGCVRWNRGTPYVTVVGCFGPLMTTLKAQFGGGIYAHGCNCIGDRPVWRWQVTGDKAMAVLEFVLESLYEKRAQAELVISMRKLKPGKRRDALEQQLSSLKTLHYHLPKETK